MRRAWSSMLFMLTIVVADTAAQQSAQPPRFFMAGAQEGASSAEVSPMLLPAYRKLTAVHWHDVSRRTALRQLGEISGLQFVYANDLIPVEETVRLDANDITVAAALTALLTGTGVDVVVSANGNAVLVRRRERATEPIFADTIRGVVSAQGGPGLPGAQIIITRGPDRAVFRTNSDQGGRYQVVVDSGTGDYLVYIAAPPTVHVPTFRKRVTRARPQERVFIVDAVLDRQAAAPQLETVTVRESKPKPTREDDRVAALSGAESAEASVAAALMPDQRGDLNAVGGTMPGVTPTSGGFSVLGLPTSQNTVTLNGLAFPSSSMPRDAMTVRRLVTSTYDPSRGWFSGADTRVTLSHDFLFSGTYATSSLERPWLQGGDAFAAKTGQRYGNVIQSAGAIGFLADERLSYNVSAQLSRRTAAMSTLDDGDVAVLGRVGVTLDDARAVVRSADSLRVPVRVSGVPQGLESTSLSLLAGVSTVARDRFTFQAKKHVAALTLYAASDATDGNALTALSTSSAAEKAGSSAVSLQASLSSFVTPALLHEFRTAISVTDRHTTPYLTMPSVSVLTGSGVTTGSSLPAVLQLGGASDANASSRRLTWETQSDTRFYAYGRAEHRARLSVDARLDAVDGTTAANYYGRFAYHSLADFAANRPAAFERTFGAPGTRGSVWNAYVSLGDYWKVSPRFEVLYGARLEGSAVVDQPANLQTVTNAFGVRTDFAPHSVHVSPRLGFTWGTDRSGAGGATLRNRHGVFVAPMIGVLRGGIGEFRSMISPSLVAGTPALGAVRQISCVGSAVPTPDWSSFLQSNGNIPQDCVGASAPSEWQATGSEIRFVGRGYAPPRSWRANLAWSAQHESLVWSVEGVYALNLDQPSLRNLNFRDVAQFSLANEGGRPVFVSATSIVPASGLSADLSARRNANFESVLQQGSKARSTMRQVTVTVSPSLEKVGRARFYGSVAYTLAASRSLTSGFETSTFGSPEARTWSAGALTPRHAFVLQASAKTENLTFSLFGRVASGLRYTPLVAGDVNGDGLWNDRAFVFDPATSDDAVLASGLRTLLSRGSASARRCLRTQVGSPAAAGSCEGPWTASSNVVVQVRSGALGTWSQRLETSLYVANPLAGIDQALHGSHLRGWGDPSYPDPVLLRATGFDGVTKRFRYEANPTFGSTAPSNTAARMPWRVTLDVRVSLGPSSDQQVLDRSLRQGRNGRPGRKRTAAQTKAFYDRILPDPFANVLELTDSLMLTSDQVRAIMVGQARFKARKDTAITAFSQWIADVPDQYDAADALRRQTDLYNAVLNFGREEIQATLRPVLNRLQLKLLPWPADVMFRAAGPMTVRDIRRQ